MCSHTSAHEHRKPHKLTVHAPIFAPSQGPSAMSLHGKQVISEPHPPWKRAIHTLTGRAQAGPAAGHMPCKLQPFSRLL
jgi:hypothetical protein